MKVLHVPSMEPVIAAISELQPVSAETEGLFFAMSYSEFPRQPCSFYGSGTYTGLHSYHTLHDRRRVHVRIRGTP